MTETIGIMPEPELASNELRITGNAQDVINCLGHLLDIGFIDNTVKVELTLTADLFTEGCKE